MFKKRLESLIQEVLAAYSGKVELSSIDDSKPRVTTIYLVSGASTNSVGLDLPSMVCDDLDWETDDEIKRRITSHVEAYLAGNVSTR